MEYDNSIAQVLIDESINMLNCSDNSNIDDITNGRSGLRFSIPRSPIEIEITGKTHNFNYFGSQRSISDSRRPSTPHIPRPMVSPQAPIGIDEFIPSMLIRYQGQVIDIAQLFQTQLGVVFGVPGKTPFLEYKSQFPFFSLQGLFLQYAVKCMFKVLKIIYLNFILEIFV